MPPKITAPGTRFGDRRKYLRHTRHAMEWLVGGVCEEEEGGGGEKVWVWEGACCSCNRCRRARRRTGARALQRWAAPSRATTTASARCFAHFVPRQRRSLSLSLSLSYAIARASLLCSPPNVRDSWGHTHTRHTRTHLMLGYPPFGGMSWFTRADGGSAICVIRKWKRKDRGGTDVSVWVVGVRRGTNYSRSSRLPKLLK